MDLFEIGSTYILCENGRWVKLNDVSRIPPRRLSHRKLLTWEPELKVRDITGACCENCLSYYPADQVPYKLLSGFCEQCSYPELWNLFMNNK